MLWVQQLFVELKIDKTINIGGSSKSLQWLLCVAHMQHMLAGVMGQCIGMLVGLVRILAASSRYHGMVLRQGHLLGWSLRDVELLSEQPVLEAVRPDIYF